MMDGKAVTVDLRSGQVTPTSAGVVLSADDSQFNAARAAWRVLEQSDVRR